MPLPTDVAGAEGDFAAQVPADLLHEIEGLNAFQDTLGNRMFHVSHAWTDGPMRCTMHKSSGAKSNSSALPTTLSTLHSLLWLAEGVDTVAGSQRWSPCGGPARVAVISILIYTRRCA